MILYPTETIYGLGVNVFDDVALDALFALKGRDEGQTASWLVRDIVDIEKYAKLSSKARAIAEQYLPGSLTLVLPAKDTVPARRAGPDKTIGIRISPDPVAQQLIATSNTPLTCTSANVSGLATEQTPAEIIEQFKTAGKDVSVITEVIDGGPRVGDPSTVVRVIGDSVEILREGVIAADDILKSVA